MLDLAVELIDALEERDIEMHLRFQIGNNPNWLAAKEETSVHYSDGVPVIVVHLGPPEKSEDQ